MRCIHVLAVLAALAVVVATWTEDEAGETERTLFDRTVHRNARFVPEQCGAQYGVPFWDALRASKRRACESALVWDHRGFGAVLLTNVSITATEARREEWETPFRDADLDVVAVCNDSASLDHTVHSLWSHVRNVRGIAGPIDPECDEWTDTPFVLLPWFDTANWWHFIEQALLPAFLYTGIAQPELLAMGRDVHMGTLRWPAKEMFNVRDKGVYPRWVALPELLDRLVGPLHVFPDENLTRTCFRALLWVRQSPTHLEIGQLFQHGSPDCYSPIVRSMADHVRAAVGVVWPASSAYHPRIRVAFVSRDPNNTWTMHQRARSWDQTSLVARLSEHVREYGCVFEDLHFYYTNMKTAREQVLRVAAAHVLVGVHGAGLATMIALPPHSAVVELRDRDPNRHFHYLASLLGHAYYQTSTMQYGSHDDSVWDTVRMAIDETWKRHPALREPRARAAEPSQSQ
jgi:hypothetical protein